MEWFRHSPLPRWHQRQQEHPSLQKSPGIVITTQQKLWKGSNGGRDGATGGLFGRNPVLRGPPTVVDLTAKNVKIGALRFLLQIHLVGIQNQPEPNSWLTKQGDDGDLQIFYKDGTGMLSLQLQEYQIKAVRYGEKPSLQYMLQESVLLHSVLDELEGVALGVEEIAEENRLLQLTEPDAIQKAREKLPARKQT